jgi:hypothetical protein
MAPRARFGLAPLRLTANGNKNLSALPGVAHEKLGAILSSLAAPNVAPKIRATIGEVVNNSVLIASLQVMNDRFVHTLVLLLNDTGLWWEGNLSATACRAY